jgi:hypothetical protein
MTKINLTTQEQIEIDDTKETLKDKIRGAIFKHLPFIQVRKLKGKSIGIMIDKIVTFED